MANADNNSIKPPLRSLECSICMSPFTDPYSLPCGHSFDKICIEDWYKKKNECPSCKNPFVISSIRKNFNLLQVAEEQLHINTNVVEIFLLDQSTSMWYSDWLVPLIGTARITTAKSLLKQFFQHRMQAMQQDKNLVVVFAVFSTGFNVLFRSDTAQNWRPHNLFDQVQPDGAQTALFDALQQGMEFLQTNFPKHDKRLVVITDGKDNFSNEKNKTDEKFSELQNLKKKLQVHSLMLGVGGNHLQQKSVADKLDFHYDAVNEKNVDIVLKGLKSRFQTPSEILESVKMRISLPDVPQTQPEHWVEISLKESHAVKTSQSV